ncbi:MAG: AbrB/MazE/SpoVT family DNA-binding domain-containing protein [Thermoanaerobaculia bacterium]
MAKVTSKLQVTVPKTIAEQLQIRPGDEIDWIPAGDAVRVVPRRRRKTVDDRQARLRSFDEATARQLRRQAGKPLQKEPRDRGWKREDLYDRGRPR